MKMFAQASQVVAMRSLLMLLMIQSSHSAMSSTGATSSPKQVCIIGAGPAGLVFAHLLLQQNPTVQIQVLEKSPREGTPDANAFGFGVGGRHERCLENIPGLWERVEAVSAPTPSGLRLVGRSTLCNELMTQLEEKHGSRCNISFGGACSTIDLDRQVVTVDNGEEIPYDLLVGADGVNSYVRQELIKDGGIQEEHFLRPVRWKSLKLPDQKGVFPPDAFKPLSFKTFRGALFPRYPGSFTALIFWKDLDLANPRGIENERDLANAITTALQPKANRWTLARNSLFGSKVMASDENVDVRFDEADLKRFVDSRPGREHFLKLDKFHHRGSVALLGDSAHGMYSLLGQGAACAFQSALTLAKSLEKESNLSTALELYSAEAVPEAHAVTDLNLVSHALFDGNIWTNLVAVPLLLFNTLRGKLLMKRLHQDVTYRQLLNENICLVWFSRLLWKRERIPLTASKIVTEQDGTRLAFANQ